MCVYKSRFALHTLSFVCLIMPLLYVAVFMVTVLCLFPSLFVSATSSIDTILCFVLICIKPYLHVHPPSPPNVTPSYRYVNTFCFMKVFYTSTYVPDMSLCGPMI